MDIQNSRSDSPLNIPCHPYTGSEIWDKVRRALSEERGYKMTLERLGRILGRQTSTIHHWLSLSDQAHVQAFICLLERLDYDDRIRILNEVCRALPTLLHPSLAHSPHTVESMISIVKQARGLTIITGGSIALRSFVLTAFGHTFSQLDPRHRMPAGLDMHQSDKIVPVEGVAYLRLPQKGEQLTKAAGLVLMQINNSKTPLLLFNGVWSLFPEFRDQILGLARVSHVIIADSAPPPQSSAIDHGLAPIHGLTISRLQENPARIRVICQKFLS